MKRRTRLLIILSIATLLLAGAGLWVWLVRTPEYRSRALVRQYRHLNDPPPTSFIGRWLYDHSHRSDPKWLDGTPIFDELGKLGEAGLPALFEIAESHDTPPYGVYRALRTAANQKGKAVPYFAALISSKGISEGVRSQAMLTGGSIGAEAKSLVPILADCLRERDPQLWGGAAQGLGKIGPDAAPVLIHVLENPDEDAQLRCAAARALGHIGAASPAVVPALVKAFHETEAPVCFVSMLALGDVGPAAQGAVPDVLLALQHGNTRMRASAAWTLGKLGLPSDAVVQALKQARGDADSLVHVNATRALAELGQEDAGK